MLKDRSFERIDIDCCELPSIASVPNYQDEPLFSHKLGEVSRQHGEPRETGQRVMSNGCGRTLRAISTVTRDHQGGVRGMGALQEAAERRLADEARDRARDELAHIARLITLGELTASIAHEINQPLSGILTNASTCHRMLAAEPPNIQGALETARRTLRDGNRASEVVQRLRALLQKKEFADELLDLNEAAGEAIALCLQDLQRRGVALHSNFDPALPPVRGDKVQLQQVILNLVLNAADAMEGVHHRPRQVIVETSQSSAGWVRLAVRDSGRGIRSEDIDKIFNAFYSTKPQGMGIGLSVSRSIIDRHSGEIWAASNDGPGTTFAFTIPNAVSNIEPR
jgi:signal transduction histidine kinase